jgi:hypothetical protein
MRDRGIGGMKDRGKEERDAGEEKELGNSRDSYRQGREKGKKEEDNGIGR